MILKGYFSLVKSSLFEKRRKKLLFLFSIPSPNQVRTKSGVLDSEKTLSRYMDDVSDFRRMKQ